MGKTKKYIKTLNCKKRSHYFKGWLGWVLHRCRHFCYIWIILVRFSLITNETDGKCVSAVKERKMKEIPAQKNSLSHLRLPNGLDVVQFQIPKSFGLADAVFTGQLKGGGAVLELECVIKTTKEYRKKNVSFLRDQTTYCLGCQHSRWGVMQMLHKP